MSQQSLPPATPLAAPTDARPRRSRRRLRLVRGDAPRRRWAPRDDSIRDLRIASCSDDPHSHPPGPTAPEPPLPPLFIAGQLAQAFESAAFAWGRYVDLSQRPVDEVDASDISSARWRAEILANRYVELATQLAALGR
jgi:hypothetical protein